MLPADPHSWHVKLQGKPYPTPYDAYHSGASPPTKADHTTLADHANICLARNCDSTSSYRTVAAIGQDQQWAYSRQKCCVAPRVHHTSCCTTSGCTPSRY
jgi:hypothetical protein